MVAMHREPPSQTSISERSRAGGRACMELSGYPALQAAILYRPRDAAWTAIRCIDEGNEPEGGPELK